MSAMARWRRRLRFGSDAFPTTTVLLLRHPNMKFFVAAVAVTACIYPALASAEARQRKEETSEGGKRKCPMYGCPLLPRDIYFDEQSKAALASIRALQTRGGGNENDAGAGGVNGSEKSENELKVDSDKALNLLRTSGGRDMATLTLIGYKGGQLKEQINQDRAFVVAPYYLESSDDDGESLTRTEEEIDSATTTADRRILGVFDGHAPLGEVVSEYTVVNLPKLLSAKLNSAFNGGGDGRESGSDLASMDEKAEEEATKEALIETFVEIDKTAPAEVSGGCTASVVLQLGHKIFVANAGDSRSFVATWIKSTGATEIAYMSREDKPHLEDERRRVESMGGKVYIPANPGATSRVLYTDPQGRQNGLAMSRSIGDWAYGKLGVIPTPIVDVVDVRDIVAAKLDDSSSCDAAIDSSGSVTTEACERAVDADDVRVFAVSATDGMMDYVDAKFIAEKIAVSLYGDGPHPLTACEDLVSMAAAGWYRAKSGRYRDDIAIAVSKIT